MTIDKSLDIEGPGAGLLAISGGDVNRVFDISEGNTVTIAGLTITHGRARGPGGGGILNAGSTLTVTGDVLSSNRAFGSGKDFLITGGAISSRNGTLSVRNSTFIDNQAIGGPNGGNAYGGAIENDAATATVTGSIFVGNQAVGGDGGDGRREQYISLAWPSAVPSRTRVGACSRSRTAASWETRPSPAAEAPEAKVQASPWSTMPRGGASGVLDLYDHVR